MASKPKLKPCPFCGGEAQLLRISKLPNGMEEWFVSCGAASCDLYPHSTIPYASAEIAAAAWNRRAVDTPSNAAAMREALVLCYRIIHCAMVAGVINRDDANKAMDAYHAALAAPPRNCDLGTAQEQDVRFEAFCHAHRSRERCCEDCPFASDKASCELAWAQMPYEEGGVK